MAIGGAKTGSRTALRAAGVAMLAIAAAALLIPIRGHVPGGAIIGWLLLAAGAVEIFAARARARDEAEGASLTAGAITIGAGILFLLRPLIGLYPAGFVIMAWLMLRGAVLLRAAIDCKGATRTWMGFAGAADLLLGVSLLIGLPIAALVIVLLRSTQDLELPLAVLLAVSQATTGIALLALSARSLAEPGDKVPAGDS